MQIQKAHRQICEDRDWAVHLLDDGYVELEKYSPAGEDFLFCVSADGFAENVRQYAAGFDVDEHIDLWVGSRGKKGVPSRVRELVEDTEAIDQMLQELAAALFAVECEEETLSITPRINPGACKSPD